MALNIDKYKQLPILKGTPNPRDLKEGVPVFRFTHQGIIQFIKYRGQLYNTIFEPTKFMHKKEGFISEKANGGSFTFKQGKIDSTSNALESFSFFENFKVECFGVFLNPQLADERYTNHVATNITKNGFDIDRYDSAGDATINYLAIGK